MRGRGDTVANVAPGTEASALAAQISGRDAVASQAAPADVWRPVVLHDLNNELTILKWQIDVLRRRANRAEVLENLSPLEAAAQKLIRLAGELRDGPDPSAERLVAADQRRCAGPPWGSV